MAIVFTDTYTVASDTNINAYPAGDPDYVYNRGTGANLTVNAANDQIRTASVSGSFNAYLIDPTAPTGNQEITATVSVTGSSCSFLSVRNQPLVGGAVQFYLVMLDTLLANDTEIRRRDNATTLTLLAGVDNGLVNGSHTARLRATGSGATVSLSVWIDASAPLTYDDTSEFRITSGPPGVGMFQTAGAQFVDDVSVDDLAGLSPAAYTQVGYRWRTDDGGLQAPAA